MLMAPVLLYVGQGNETRESLICATGASSDHGPLTISLVPTYPVILLGQLSGFGNMQNPFKLFLQERVRHQRIVNDSYVRALSSTVHLGVAAGKRSVSVV